ncbi:MAG: hypothetical protein M2R45_02474 [Verrucomicrobia subdivision 3 bacterium]|nr:hypothetical protein [Limisphaerales bacterium]MCS1413262.1 hypothetical protein [Limisphaerales bacterium]
MWFEGHLEITPIQNTKRGSNRGNIMSISVKYFVGSAAQKNIFITPTSADRNIE